MTRTEADNGRDRGGYKAAPSVPVRPFTSILVDGKTQVT